MNGAIGLIQGSNGGGCAVATACAALGLIMTSAHAGEEPIATMSCVSPVGAPVVGATPGAEFTAVVRIDSGLPIAFNSALFRLVLTRAGVAITEYEWAPPFVTGGLTDLSLIGLELPALIDADSLAGPGFPEEVIDVSFGNFLLAGSHGPGELLSFGATMPADAAVGEEFFLIAVPDTLALGFVEIPTEVGTVLTVRAVATPDLSGDGVVGAIDLGILLGAWSTPGGDLDGDGDTNAADLAILLGAWA